MVIWGLISISTGIIVSSISVTRSECSYANCRVHNEVCNVCLPNATRILILLLSFFGAMCTRFLLGFVEAAFFPGALVLFGLLLGAQSLIVDSFFSPNGIPGMSFQREPRFFSAEV